CSLLLFYKVAQLLLPPKAVWIALGLAAVCPHLVYYSSELKQYSTDVLVAAALAFVILTFALRPPEVRMAVILALAGAVAIWISHPAPIILAGMGSTVIVSSLLWHDWRRLTALLVAIAFWSMSFAAFYLISVREIGKNHFFYLYWATSFMPHDLLSFSTWR